MTVDGVAYKLQAASKKHSLSAREHLDLVPPCLLTSYCDRTTHSTFRWLESFTNNRKIVPTSLGLRCCLGDLYIAFA